MQSGKTKQNKKKLFPLVLSLVFLLCQISLTSYDDEFLTLFISPKTLVQSADWWGPVVTAFHPVKEVLLALAAQRRTLCLGRGTETHSAHHSVHMAEWKGLGTASQAQPLGCIKEETGL